MPSPRALVAALGLVGYVAIAASVRNVYPFSTFEMYADAPRTSASRVIARGADGRARELDEYGAFRCDGPTPLGPAACPADWPYGTTTYLDRAAVDWIDAHPGDGGERIEIVRRIFRLSPAGPPVVRDCVLNRCQAAPR